MTIDKLVVIVDYGVGNTASVKKVFHALGVNVILSSKKEDLKKASHIVLPGVGAFGTGMKKLADTGIIPYLTERVMGDKIPFLGICLGMQLLAEQGSEYGIHKGLGWLTGDVVKMEEKVRLPHVGWNDIEIAREGVLLRSLPDLNFYFVHSYHFACNDPLAVFATCDYGQEFVAVVQKGNIFGTQFHPEKSQLAGLQVLKNFLLYD